MKEPHYFTQHDLTEVDGDELRRQVSEGYLRRFFDHCDGRECIRAEGSVTYLYMPERMDAILRLWPDARFVIALRDPLDMLPSLHQRLLITGDENIRDFPTAWSKVAERREGKSIPRSAVDPRFLRYDEAGALGSAVERFMAKVGREKCHIVLFDDLVGDPQGTYRSLCEFLGLEPWQGTEWRQRRENKTFRIGWLQRLLKRPPKMVRTVMAGEKFRQREKALDARDGPLIAAIFRARKALLNWNKVPSKRMPLDPDMRSRIIDTLRDEIILLSRVIDRDLSHWLGGVPDAARDVRQARRA